MKAKRVIRGLTALTLKLNAGLDAKIGVTNNMIMSLTVNPDFGQVEADPSEVNLTAFEIIFSGEKAVFCREPEYNQL